MANEIQPSQVGGNTSANPVAPLPPAPSLYNNSVNDAQTPNKTFGINSLLLFGLLLLTFFTPLGSALFLPIILVGMFTAYRYVFRGHGPSGEQSALQKNPIFRLFKLIVICGMAIVLLILGFIALVFIGLATGVIKLDFGC